MGNFLHGETGYVLSPLRGYYNAKTNVLIHKDDMLINHY